MGDRQAFNIITAVHAFYKLKHQYKWQTNSRNPDALSSQLKWTLALNLEYTAPSKCRI